jgi:Flp pilus assembly protein TadG
MKLLKNEKGGSILEFVLISPLLFVLLFGIIEFGVLLHDRAIIINASREGARYGIVFGTPRPTQAEIEAFVANYISNVTPLISLGGGAPPVINTTLGAVSGDPLTVTVNYTYRFLVFSNLIALIGGTSNPLINLEGQAVMRME